MKSNKIAPKTLPGFMELLPSEQLVFEKVAQVLRSVYSNYGFYPLDTPILEYSQILMAKAGGETEKQIYRFNKGDTDLTMRFDLTVPLAKYVAGHANELAFPFKRYQIGKVYRGERAQRGRFREFYQADIDIIGDGQLSTINDAEIPSIIYDTFTQLGIKDFTIRINNRKILSGFFNIMGLSENTVDILRIVDKLEKIGRDNVIEELINLKVSPEDAETILNFVNAKGSNQEKLDYISIYKGKDEVFDAGFEELALVLNYIHSFGVPESNYTIDYSIARGLDYYTGTVYETMINAHPEIGSVCSGGRYDNLAEYYTDRKLPGVGISIGLTRLFYVLSTMKAFEESNFSAADVMIIPMTEDLSYAIETSSALRKSGLRTQIYFESKKVKQKMAYANKTNMPCVLLLGEDEEAAGRVTVKFLETGEQVTDTLEVVTGLIQACTDKKHQAYVIQNMNV